MEIEQQKELWNRIQDFSIDDPSASIKYSDKLAHQNQWSANYTARVIEEYKKFIFLCCTLPGGASPSHAVDEAWHLHLTYTHNYWKEFCGKTLQREVHHHPSKGGGYEDERHQNWYLRTLSAYQQYFGYEPPPDIWPVPFIQPIQDQRKLDMLSHIQSYKWYLPLLFTPFFISSLLYERISPFNLNGPQFLFFYFVLAVIAIIVVYLAAQKRQVYIKDLIDKYADTSANIFQVAKFIYSREHSIKAAVVDLTVGKS